MTDLRTFLVNLSQDSSLRLQYDQDPRGVMNIAGLSPDVIEAILSGDRARITSQFDVNAIEALPNIMVCVGLTEAKKVSREKP